jgi:hypothetical protein
MAADRNPTRSPPQTDETNLVAAPSIVDFRNFLADPELIEIWSSHKDKEVTEEDSDCEGRLGPLDVVFVPKEDFNDTYSHTDGLGALPKTVEKATRSSGPPSLGEAHLAGKAEDTLRKALKCERTRLLATTAEENERTGKLDLDFFAGWEPLVPYTLPRAENLVEEVEEKIQQRWDNAKLDIQAMGNGGGLEGWFGIFHSWFTPTDWRSLYRAQAPTIHAWEGRDVSKKKDYETLEHIETQLLDTTKYNGACEFMTVVTYGDDKYGTVSLFRVTLQPGPDALAGQMELLAYADRVPIGILKDLRIQNRIEYVQKDGKVRCIREGGQYMPSLVRVTTRTVNRRGKESVKHWEELGQAWRTALGIAFDKDNDDDGLVATIPQMMTLLHLKGYGLHNLGSTPVQDFKEPLKSVPYDDTRDAAPCESANPNWEIKRGIQITRGPERYGHPGRRLKVVTIFPGDSAWAKEMLLWA